MQYLGIEIGGTKLQLGVGPGDGTLAGLWRGTVDPEAGGEGIRRQITAAVPELLVRSGVERSHLRSVGIGFGGPVDDATRTVITSHQIKGWDGFPLADWIGEITGLQAALGNDADVAGLAEALFGAGKGLSPIFYITIGSGIGGGLIINGEVYRGCGRGAAEIGHLRMAGEDIWLGAEFSDCHLEKLASGWAIERTAKSGLEDFFTHADREEFLALAGAPPNHITARHVAQAAQRGNALAAGIMRDMRRYLADALCQVITLLCPRRIVIGGGVSLMGEQLLFEPLRKLVAERVFAPFAGYYDIVPAALSEEVVVHGALALARRRLGGVG
jgi:glucokinase